MEKEAKKAIDTEIKEDGKELNLEELGEVTGGANPFAAISRVPDKPLDAEVRKKA